MLMSGTNVNHRPRSIIPAFPTCWCISFRFAYANGGDESLPPSQCKIKTEISVLLYPAILITRFIPAFFTEGYPWITPTTYEAVSSATSLGNEIGFSTEDGIKVSSLDEDTPPNDSGIISKQQVRPIQTFLKFSLIVREYFASNSPNSLYCCNMN